MSETCEEQARDRLMGKFADAQETWSVTEEYGRGVRAMFERNGWSQSASERMGVMAILQVMNGVNPR